MHEHPCTKCTQPIDCKLVGSQHYLASNAILFDNNVYHKNCIPNTTAEEESTANTNNNDKMDLDNNNDSSKQKQKQKQKQQND